MKARRLPKGMPAGLSLLAILALLGSLLPGGYQAAYAQGAAMPEGWHDGAEGTVDEGGCAASGWAVDPDDRDRDVLVQILADGLPDPIASVYASDYGEDMDVLGICPGGTCRFTVPLWDLISHDEAHAILAQVWDVESASWVNLEGTPRTLTCATPPPPAPRLVVSIAHNWLEVQNFPAEALVNLAVYASADPGAAVLWQGEKTADGSGWVFVGPWEHLLDLSPGQFVVANDGTTLRELVLEPITLDIFDAAADYLAGAAPPAPGGRLVWVGTGNALSGCSMLVTADAGTGAWAADFSTQPCDVTDDMWGAAQVFDADGDATEANPVAPPPPPPSPNFRALPDQDFVDGWNWPLDAVVHLAIDDPANGPGADYEQDATVIVSPWDPAATFVLFEFAGAYDLKRGDAVSLSSDGIVRALVVPFMWITSVDSAADLVAGTAEPGAWVHVFIGGDTELFVTANSDGDWLADFAGIGFDLQPWMDIAAEVWDDDGDSAIVNWWGVPPPPTPWLTAFPEYDAVEGWEWPEGASVHLSIDDPATALSPDSEADGVAQGMWWGGTYFRVEFAGAYDLKAGDIVELTDGTTTATHVVRNLAITGVDIGADTVAGTADPGTWLQTWAHEQTAPWLEMTAGDDGTWLADFTGTFDIVPGTGGRARIPDEHNNATEVDWSAPPSPPTPWLTAHPEWEYVEAVDWAVGVPVHLAIDDPGTPASPDYQADTTTLVPDWESNPERGWALFPLEGYDLKAGDVVVMTGDGFTLEHSVRNLSVTAVDMEADTVAGTADPGVWLQVWAHQQAEPPLDVQAGDDGAWLADFTGTFDIIQDSGGFARIVAEGGNATAANWTVPPPPPSPWVNAYPEWDAVEGGFWIVGTWVHLTVDDPATDEFPDVALDGEVFEAEWAGGQPRAWFDLAPYDLKPGDVVVLTDGETIRTHVVRNLAITVVDAEADTVAGTADPGMELQVWVHEQSEPPVAVTVDDYGNWLADLAGVVDIVPGAVGRSQSWDVEGNATIVDWSAPPLPWLIAFPENDAVEGWEWPLGATVHLTIDDPATGEGIDFEADGVAAATWWGDPRTYLRLEFWGAYDLKAGDLVVLTDGVQTAVHVVQNLSVTMANGAADFLAGAADPSAHIWVWPHGFDETATLEVNADADGLWRASFRDVFDLIMWTGGRAQIVDEGGNATAVDWVVTEPASAATTEVHLPADAGWLDTGFMVWEGVPVVIRAEGQARTGHGQGYATSHSGPDGQTWTCPAWEGMPPCALDGAPYGALIGRIGLDGEPFLIGASFVLDPNASGILYLAVNDNLPWYGDNQGHYLVFLSY